MSVVAVLELVALAFGFYVQCNMRKYTYALAVEEPCCSVKPSLKWPKVRLPKLRLRNPFVMASAAATSPAEVGGNGASTV